MAEAQFFVAFQRYLLKILLFGNFHASHLVDDSLCKPCQLHGILYFNPFWQRNLSGKRLIILLIFLYKGIFFSFENIFYERKWRPDNKKKKKLKLFFRLWTFAKYFRPLEDFRNNCSKFSRQTSISSKLTFIKNYYQIRIHIEFYSNLLPSTLLYSVF